MSLTAPIQLPPARVAPDTTALTAYLPIPGLGALPVNAFVVDAAQPVLIDTGVVALAEPFLATLAQAIDPAALAWIVLTHVDADHIGGLRALLELAPRARVVTTFLGLGKLDLIGGLDPSRAYLLNPGQRLDVGDRELAAFKPASYDAPETTGFVDTRTGVMFSSDSFGALLAEPAERADAIAPAALRDGMTTWATIDAPWLAGVRPEVLTATLASLRALGPTTVLSSHLPAAPGMFDTLADILAAARTASPFVGPDQAAFEQAMRGAA